MDPMLTSYNDNCTIQETCQVIGNPILANFSCQLGLEHRGGRIAEYGCSGGRNSMDPVKAILGDAVPSDSATSPPIFEVILEDLPSNPWHQVMAIADSHRTVLNNVRFLCAGTSFYEPVCAPESVDIGYSYVSVHFLRGAPPLDDHLIYHESNSIDAKNSYKAQSAADWEQLLLLRAQEMKPGGKLLLSTMGRDDEDGYSWKLFSNAVWEAMNKCSPEVCI